ncbi:MAG: YhbY family RNA-binding protein [Bacillus subtilis]|nr:YhbY family RNA-binding protein [Bacillus subtilis]
MNAAILTGAQIMTTDFHSAHRFSDQPYYTFDGRVSRRPQQYLPRRRGINQRSDLMELNSKQISELKSMAQTIKSVFQVGKEGWTPVFEKNILDYIKKNELMKITLLPTTPEEAVRHHRPHRSARHAPRPDKSANQLVLFKHNSKLKDGIRVSR